MQHGREGIAQKHQRLFFFFFGAGSLLYEAGFGGYNEPSEAPFYVSRLHVLDRRTLETVNLQGLGTDAGDLGTKYFCYWRVPRCKKARAANALWR